MCISVSQNAAAFVDRFHDSSSSRSGSSRPQSGLQNDARSGIGLLCIHCAIPACSLGCAASLRMRTESQRMCTRLWCMREFSNWQSETYGKFVKPGHLSGKRNPRARERFLRSFRKNFPSLCEGRKIQVVDCSISQSGR